MLRGTINIYFLGIGGIGMSAIARWANIKGFNIQGWDDNPDTVLIKNLLSEGILVEPNDLINQDLPVLNWNSKESIMIYTPAISKKHKCFQWFKVKILKYINYVKEKL